MSEEHVEAGEVNETEKFDALPQDSNLLMLTLSKPLSAGQIRTYHERESASEQQNYWSWDQREYSEWQGSLEPVS
jgi:hypothetical protein